MNNRLQFRHHGVGSGYTVVDGVFENREKAIDYIINDIRYSDDGLSSTDPSYGFSLYAEPTVLRYTNEDDENDPHVILAIGSMTNESGRYSNNKFCIIDIDKTESEIAELGEELEKAIQSLSIVALDTDTIDLHSEKTSGGTVISGDVKVPETYVFEGERMYKDNAIVKTENGIFVYVNLEYDRNADKFTFTVNNHEQVFEIDNNYVVGGEYIPEDESLHLRMKHGDDIVVDLDKLIAEWVVEGENAKSPIILTREEVGYGDDAPHHHVEPWQDILSADVRIADDRANNILKKTTDNRYLYVDGVATNIAYYKNGVKSNVQAALDDLSSLKISTDSNNILTTKLDGFFASTKLEYISSENTLVFTTSTNDEDERKKETRIKLNTFSLFERIDYIASREVLVITYIDGNGQTQFVEIPIGEMIADWEWTVNNYGHSVFLQKERMIQGADQLSADVNIFQGNNNILEDVNHQLYVKGTADNIKYGNDSTVEGEIVKLYNKDSALDNKINIETSRAEAAEQTLDGKIDSVKEEIGDGFGPRNTVRDEINNLQGEVDAVSAETSAKLKDIVNNDHSINVDKTDATVPVIKVNLSSEIEDNKPNIIKVNGDGLYAGVDLIYEFNEEVGTNQLIFKTTNGTKTYDLKTNSVIDKIYYDPSREAIIIEYTVNGHRMPDVVIPLGDLINEWRIWDGHEGAVQLEKLRIASGTSEQDVLKASVVISETHNDNILINDNGALYVSGKDITDNANAIGVLNDKMVDAESDIDALENGLSAEITRATNEESRIDTALNNEIARSTEKDTNIENALNAEVSRSTQKDQELTDAIANENIRAISAETALKTASDLIEANLNALSNNVDSDVARLDAKDAELESKLDTIDGEYLINFDNTNTISILKNPASKGYVVKANINIDGSDDNNVKETANGIYSKVDLTYDETSNKLTFVNTNGSKEIALVSNSIVNKIYYQPADETIVIEYTVNGVRQPDVVVPVRDLINEIDVASTETVELIKTPNTSTGADIISANVNINSYHNDNILVNDGGLYVSGSQIETNKDNIESLDSRLGDEVSRATAAENALSSSISDNASAISTESIRAISAETILSNSIAAEETRATNKENALESKINNDIASVESALENAIATEKNRAENAESSLSDRIDEVDAKTFTLTVDDTTTIDLTLDGNNKLSGNVVLANGENNIIKAASNSVDGSGLYASVDMEYNPATNKLKLITSAVEKEFSLSVGSIIKSIEYDSVAKNIIIKYDVNIGGVIHEEEVFVPVEDLFNDWTVQQGQHLGAIILTKTEGTSGQPDILSAEVVISTLSDNMLVNDQGSLYVSSAPINAISGQIDDISAVLEDSLRVDDTATLHLNRSATQILSGDVKISEREDNLIKVDGVNGGIMFDGNIDCGTY